MAQATASTEALETREQNLQHLGVYLVEGTPLERGVLLELLREPEVVADELVGEGRLATMIVEKVVEAGGEAPEVKARYEQVCTLLEKAGATRTDTDYLGETSVQVSRLGAPAVDKVNRNSNRSIHRRRDSSRVRRPGIWSENLI